MADVYVNALTQISTEPTSTDSLVAVNRNTNEGKIIDYNKLADVILNKLTSKTFSALNTSSKLVTGAINELDSDISSLNGRIDDTTTRTTLNSTYPTGGSNKLYWYRFATTATGNPSGNSGFCFEMWFSSTTCTQFVVTAEPAYYVRKLVGGTWSDWLDLNSSVATLESRMFVDLVPTSSDGRYYSCSFSVTGSRAPVLVVYASQTATTSGTAVVVVKTDGSLSTQDSRVTNPETGRLQVDCGPSAWNRPIIIHDTHVTIGA